MNRIKSLYTGIYKNFIFFLKGVKINKLGGISLHDFISEYIYSIKKNNIALRAKSMSFSFFMSIFPMVIFLFSILPYVPIENLDFYIIKVLEKSTPDNMDEVVRDTVQDIVNIKRGGILSFSFITIIYLVSMGINSMIKGLEFSFSKLDKRSNINKALTSLVLSFLLIFIMTLGTGIITTVIIYTSKYMKQFEEVKSLVIPFIQISTLLGIAFLFYLCIALLFYFGRKKTRGWNFFSLGPLVSCFLILLTTYGFEEYVKDFANYNKVYGSIGTLIMIMFWIYLNSLSTLIGFELNVVIHKFKKIKYENSSY